MLDAQLIAVGLADRAVRTSPAVPDVAAQLRDTVGLFLPDPQKLLDAGLVVGSAERHDRKFLLQVVAVHDAEFLDRVRGRPVLPVRTDLAVGVPDAVCENVPAGRGIDGIGFAHGDSSCKMAAFFIV